MFEGILIQKIKNAGQNMWCDSRCVTFDMFAGMHPLSVDKWTGTYWSKKALGKYNEKYMNSLKMRS
jgi:hypothetical protein